jgi:hypothetical protein
VGCSEGDGWAAAKVPLGDAGALEAPAAASVVGRGVARACLAATERRFDECDLAACRFGAEAGAEDDGDGDVRAVLVCGARDGRGCVGADTELLLRAGRCVGDGVGCVLVGAGFGSLPPHNFS